MSDLTLALTGLSSTSAVGTAGVGSSAGLSVVQSITAVSGIGAPGTVAMTLPVPRLVSEQNFNVAGKVPTPIMVAMGMTGNVGAVTMTLPLIVWSLDMLGRDGALATLDVNLPVPQLSISGATGITGTVAMALPTPVLAISEPNAAVMALPVPQLQVSGTTGVVGTSAMTMPMPQVAATAAVPFVAVAAMLMPAPTMLIAGVSGNVGRMNAQLASFALSLRGTTGTIGAVAITLPISRFTATGYEQEVGAVTIQLPSLQLQATGRTSTATGTPVTVAMQTETLSLSTYSNYAFNSYAKFNGVFLGASDAGVFALTGATDNSAQIDAYARVGMSDFGTSHLKRIDRIYVGYRADGNLVLRVFTDEVTQRDYLLQSSQRTGLHGNHTRLGKGLVARYWQFEVRNTAGGDFSMDIVELKPTKLARRVGGTDA